MICVETRVPSESTYYWQYTRCSEAWPLITDDGGHVTLGCSELQLFYFCAASCGVIKNDKRLLNTGADSRSRNKKWTVLGLQLYCIQRGVKVGTVHVYDCQLIDLALYLFVLISGVASSGTRDCRSRQIHCTSCSKLSTFEVLFEQFYS